LRELSRLLLRPRDAQRDNNKQAIKEEKYFSGQETRDERKKCLNKSTNINKEEVRSRKDQGEANE
jgi:hypothetical protein